MNAFETTIKAYLDKRAAGDASFAEAYANPKKSLKECCDYIVTEVRRSGRTAMADEEVFSLAVHYYDEQKPGAIESGIAARARVVVPEIPENEKEMLKQEAIREYKDSCIAEIRERESKIRQIKTNKQKEEAQELPQLF